MRAKLLTTRKKVKLKVNNSWSWRLPSKAGSVSGSCETSDYRLVDRWRGSDRLHLFHLLEETTVLQLSIEMDIARKGKPVACTARVHHRYLNST